MSNTENQESAFGSLSKQLGDTSPTGSSLGSLAQSSRYKQLRTARWVFVFLGIVMTAFHVFQFVKAPMIIDAEFKKETDNLVRQGMQIDQDKLQEIRATTIRSAQLMMGGFIGVGILYLLFALIINKYPVAVTVSGLVIYFTVMALNAYFDPSTLAQGWIVKILVIAALLKAVQAAIAFERDRRVEIVPTVAN